MQQDVFSFGGTAQGNIACASVGASEYEIVEAARRLQMETTIAARPTGLDKTIGERGVKLSGSQKQRQAMGRTFLEDPAKKRR